MSFSFVAHSPDNSFLGFAVPSKAQENNTSRNKPNNRALVYGKVPAFWKVSPTKIFKSNYSSFEWRRMVKYQCSERSEDGPTCLMSTTIQQIALSDGSIETRRIRHNSTCKFHHFDSIKVFYSHSTSLVRI